ncbi:MAG: type VI secretion protein ImpB [Pseudomonadota bacterium]
MQRPTEIESLYIDFDAFFANVEKQLCPELRNRPVGVIPLQSDHTSLIARCYLAKAAGLSRGTSVLEARERCPDIALPVARHDEYVRIHHQILDEVNQHVPVQKVWSVDEMECALIGAERQDCVKLAHRIREGLRTSIGAYVTPSIGLAPNQFLAKVAAEMDKPNGFVMLHPDDLPGRLFDLKLTDLPGISKGIEVRLLKAGITSVEALWNLAPKHARKIWGSVEGERFWAQLRGYRVSRPETVRRMFGHGRVLSREWREPANARDCLRLLTAKAARRLRREGYMATVLNVGLTSAQNDRRGAHIRFSPASDDYTFLGHACTLFDTLTSQMHTPPLKKVSVSLMGLHHQRDCHEDLLEAPSNRANRQKWQTLTETMDDLNARYEACVVSLGMHRQPRGGYAGAKIAFGRVPDLMDFATTPEAAAGTPR